MTDHKSIDMCIHLLRFLLTLLLSHIDHMMTSSNGNIFRVTGPLWGIHRSPVNSPHKGQWRGTLKFSLICAWTNGWINNLDASDLTRHRAHYDVTVMNLLIYVYIYWGFSLILLLSHIDHPHQLKRERSSHHAFPSLRVQFLFMVRNKTTPSASNFHTK